MNLQLLLVLVSLPQSTQAAFFCFRTNPSATELDQEQCHPYRGCETRLLAKDKGNFSVEVGCNSYEDACQNHVGSWGFSVCCRPALCNHVHELLRPGIDIQTAAGILKREARRQLVQENTDRLPNPVPKIPTENGEVEKTAAPMAEKQVAAGRPRHSGSLNGLLSGTATMLVFRGLWEMYNKYLT